MPMPPEGRLPGNRLRDGATDTTVDTRINLARTRYGEELDARYLRHPSADAVPVLVEAPPRMSQTYSPL